MRLGIYYPQNELGTDPEVITEFAQGVESMGYDHVMIFDHVAPDTPESKPGWNPAYKASDPLSEVFCLYSFMAAVTTRLEMAVGVLLLSQRQTVLVAKQAAVVDILSKGRLRLGVGTGWNEVEYEALGMDWKDRGARIDEQVRVLQKLWTNEVVTYHGKYHTLNSIGLNPLPVQRPIPIWFGGRSEAVYKRTGELGSGFLPLTGPDEKGVETLERIAHYAREFDRDPSEIKIDVRVHLGGHSSLHARKGRPAEDLADEAVRWKAMGATHATFNTRHSQLETVKGHLAAAKRIKNAADSALAKG